MEEKEEGDPKEDIKNEKAPTMGSPFFGNMITAPFNDVKAKGHIRGHIMKISLQKQISALQCVPCSLRSTLVNITFSLGAIGKARYWQHPTASSHKYPPKTQNQPVAQTNPLPCSLLQGFQTYGKAQKATLNVLPKIENPPIIRSLEHTSINGPPFPMTSRSRIRYFFTRGRLISLTRKRWGIMGTIAFGPAPLLRRPRQIKAHRLGPSILSRITYVTTFRMIK